jgi:hypothetical protein
LLSRLTEINRTSPELQKERSLLLGKANELGTLIDAFLDACDQEDRAELKQRHQEIKQQGREQLAVCERLNQEFAIATATFNEANVAKTKAIDEVQGAVYRKEHLHRFASDSTIFRAGEAVARAKQQAAKAVQKLAETIAERNAAEDRLLAAKARLNELGTEEIRLRGGLGGKPYIDPELGLDVPA